MPVSTQAMFRFEEFVLDLGDVSLRDRHGRITLRRKSFAVLRHLLENAGRLAEKDQIIQAVWPTSSASDVSLAQCVSEIRVALRDRDQRIIRTVPGCGYIFAAALLPPGGAAAAPHEPASPSLPRHTAAPPRFAPAMNDGLRTQQVERRHLTILSCEWLGLDALAARIDPEDLRATVAACQLRCGELIEREGGFIAHMLDDGALAYFGYPVAGGSDAERAVGTGLKLLELVPRLRTGQVQARIGVASGVVVIGDEPAGRPLAVGLTPHLARRLRAKADPNALLIDPATRRLLRRRFIYGAVDALTLGGSAEAVEIWRVLEAANDSGLPAQPPSHASGFGI
jgi:DNA-binding winged helix-turn-helix (wHTH) protein